MIGAVIALVAGAAIAALLAAADGALVTEGETGEPPSSAAERERAHRAFVIGRMLAYLTTGATSWWLVQGVPSRGGRVAIVAAIALIVVLFVEGIARSVGDAWGARGLRRVRFAEVLFRRLLAPAATAGAWLDSWLERIIPPARGEEAEVSATPEQFREVVAADAEVGQEERVLLDGVFTLGETEVREVMVPRVEVVAVDREMHWSELVDRLRSTGHARLPVFQGEIDDVIGVVYAKDLLPFIVAGEEPSDGWAAHVRPASFIPATKTLDAQLRDFKSGGTHIAVVVDEYGGMAGIVTIEDVLEQIVGEIRDEHDDEEAELVREGRDRFWASGRLPMAQLEEATGHEFSDEDVATVGGLVYARLGRVPRAGETLIIDDFRVVVERVVRRRILRVYLERLVGARAARARQTADGR